MAAENFSIYQIQAIAEKAFKQRLNRFGQPSDSIISLQDWHEIARQNMPYPSQLHQLLFGKSEVDRDLAHGLILQLIPAKRLSTIEEVLGIVSPNEGVAIDWTHALPWEAMLWHFWQQSNIQSFSDWMVSPECKHMVRAYWQAPSIDLSEATKSIGWRLNLLFATSEPSTHATLQAKQQLVAMEQVIETVGNANYPTLAVTRLLHNTTIDELVDALSTASQEMPIHIVHLVAHGTVGADGVGRLILVDSDGRPIEENIQQIKNAIQTCFERTKMIPFLFVINACSSDGTNFVRVDDSVARSLAETGIPYIVANQYAITVAEMHSFTQAFYEQIALWQPIHRAVMAGRRAILLDHDKDPLAPIARSLPSHYRKSPKLIDTDGGMPGWIVPVMYMSRDMDGYLPQWSPPSHILWPLDSKVMVRINYGDNILYVDETPVTEGQYSNIESLANSNDSRWTSLNEVRENIDNGLPQTDITPLDMVAYCERMKKRMITKEVWLHLAAMDPDYDAAGGYIKLDYGHYKCERRGNVRIYKNHCVLWDFSGNSYEIVTDSDGAFYKVSSPFVSSSLRAFSQNDLKTKIRAVRSNPHVGFRTMITLNDIMRLENLQPLFRFYDDKSGA